MAHTLTEKLSRIAGEQTDPISIMVTPHRNQILFHLTNIDLVSQLIDGKFPDYHAIIPQLSTTRAMIDTQLMLKAYKAANVFAREAANIARLTFVPGDDLTPGHITVWRDQRGDGRQRRRLGCGHQQCPARNCFQREISD